MTKRHASEFMSREIAAGYLPAVLNTSTLLCFGAGAVSSNLVQTCALSGIHELRHSDDDRVAVSNVTRSPLFTVDDAGEHKARVLAERAARIASAPAPRMRYATARAKDIGLGAFEGVDVAFAGVDSLESRAEIADMARLTGTPLVECGFDGSVLHVTLWSNRTDNAPCFRCFMPSASPERASCSIYASEALAQGFLPAVQSVAAVAANIAAETVIQALHGHLHLAETYLELDVVRGTFKRFRIAHRAGCRGAHRVLPPVTATIAGRHAPAHAVFDALPMLRHPVILLPDTFVVSAPCATCGVNVPVGCPLRTAPVPRCRRCLHGPGTASGYLDATQEVRPHDAIASLPLATLGYGPRDLVVVRDEPSNGLVVVRLDDPPEHVFRDVTARLDVA